MGLLCIVYTVIGITWYVVCRVVLEAIIIDVTSVPRFGDISFYRMPAYKTYSCQKEMAIAALLFELPMEG